MFKIGEFSKFTQVPGSALRYYDEIGLFKPKTIDSTSGYRFYSASQIPVLNKIVALKELGFNLDQIRNLLEDNVSPTELKGMFALRKAEIANNISDEMARMSHIEARLSQIEQPNLLDIEVEMKSLPAQGVFSIRENIRDFTQAQLIIMTMIKSLHSKLDRSIIGSPVAILHSECFEKENIDVEFCVQVNKAVPETIKLIDGRLAVFKELEQQKFAVCNTRVGSLSGSFCNRGAVAGWIESSNYELIGKSREIFIVPPRPGRESETVVEFQYPVKLLE